MPPIEDLIRETGDRSYRQYQNIRNWVRGTWAYMLLATAIMVISLFVLSQALDNSTKATEKATSVLERRSPVLEYMYCIDDNQGKINEAVALRNEAQTNFLFALLEAGDEVSPEEETNIGILADIYSRKESALTKISQPNAGNCPDAPN